MLLTAELPAQVVRGRVTEVSRSAGTPPRETSSAPVAGALVSLIAGSVDSAVVSVLTTRAGDYAVRVPAAGQYRLAVKRIGFRRFVSAPFEISEGETLALDLPLDALAQALPAVTVSGLCAARPGELAHIASLWDEVRTALQATEISLRDRMTQAQVTRYVAELGPRDLEVLFDWRSDAEAMVGTTFTSLSGDSLSALGYWREVPGDSVQYHAPDAGALASNAFLRDHCFSLAPARRDRPGLVGLSFASRNRRVVPDITGTVWIDARRYELRYVEFRYTRLPRNAPDLANAGGEVHFARLSTGAWIVERWFIRTPRVIADRDRSGEPGYRRFAPVGSTRRVLLEGGGAVSADRATRGALPAVVAGVVRDSAGRPMSAAVVRAVGTDRETLTARDGTYRLDSLPGGFFSIVAHAPGYDSLAMLVGSERVELKAGETALVDFKAADATALRALVCPVNIPHPAGSGVLRVVMLDSATAAPLTEVAFVVAWPPTPQTREGRPDRDRHRVAVTDNRGAATFCDLPNDIELELSRLGPGGLNSVVMTFEVPRSGIVGRTLRGTVDR
jgi:hypothetical protein